MKDPRIRKLARPVWWLTHALLWLAVPSNLLAQPCNTAPAAFDDTVAHNGRVIVVDVLANDVESDGEALTIAALSTTCSGSLSEDFGLVTLQPPTPVSEECTISYTIADERGGSASATVQVHFSGLLFMDSFESGDTSAWSSAEVP